MGRPWEDPDSNTGCCCSRNWVHSFPPADPADAVHVWDAETWPHPYTVSTVTFGGAVVNSYSLVQGAPAEYYTVFGGGQTVKTGNYSLQLELDVTSPAGRWNAWVILWMPASNIPVEEVLDVTDPAGIVTLQNIISVPMTRLRRMSRNISTGPFVTVGLAVEYDSVTYYTPDAYLINNPPALRPHCWRQVTNQNAGETIDSGTLDYSGNPLSFGCKPSPATLDRVGIVVGLTSVAADPVDDRTIVGDTTASINLDNIYAVANYAVNCACWFADPALTQLTATFKAICPVEIAGETLTLLKQPDGTFTASGTYGSPPLPYTLTYTPCVSLVLELTDCDEIANPNFPTWTLTFLQQTQTYDPWNCYLDSSVWEPIDVTYRNRACIAPPGSFGSVGLPFCGLTSNTTLPVGSPPFVEIWPCWLFDITLEE